MAKKKTQQVADIGMIGLGVMGRNLALNMVDHGFAVAAFDVSAPATRRFVKDNPDTPAALFGCTSLKNLVTSLSRPRKIVILVPAGNPVDQVLGKLMPLLTKGDIVVDGGNSKWTDTIRREKAIAAKGVNFVGCGVSGGEEGARFGPSLMPGGSKEAWKQLKPIWTAIAARVDRKTGKPLEGAAPGKPVRGGVPCTAHIGPDGAGHYVKMVHNGIEYADMQLICEAYFIMKQMLGLKPQPMSKIFGRWNRGDLDSFLIEITQDILQQTDPANPRQFFVDAVLDKAGQKGTGKWTATNALDLGVASASIAEAVFARAISSIKDQRVDASKQLRGPTYVYKGAKQAMVNAIRDALYCSKICAYAQGFAQMTQAQQEYSWKLNFGQIAKLWRGGCIIRARFLQKITDAYARDRKLPNLLLDPYFKRQIHKGQANWRQVISTASLAGVPCPAFMSALAYYDSYRASCLPANLLQAQRDYFGAHTYERLDDKPGQFFHIDWPDPKRPQIRL